MSDFQNGNNCSIHRYDFVPGDVCGYNCSAGMTDEAEGDYVLASDYDALLAEADLLGHVADWAEVVRDRYVNPDVTQEKIDGLSDALDAHSAWKASKESDDGK